MTRKLCTIWAVTCSLVAVAFVAAACGPQVSTATPSPGGGGRARSPAAAGAATPSARPAAPVLWFADHETGDLSQWSVDEGGGIYNSGNGAATATRAVAHSGCYAAQLTVATDGTDREAVRLFRWEEPETVAQAYYSVWYYFPQRFVVRDWWNVFQWKSTRPTTLTPTPVRFSLPGVAPEDSHTDPTWIVQIDNRPSGAMYFYLYDWTHSRAYAQTLTDIPIGQWTHLEAFLRKATGPTGHVTVWQDGVLLADVADVPTSLTGDLQWSVNNYTHALTPDQSTIYIDDAMISTQRLGTGGEDGGSPSRAPGLTPTGCK